jgi:hypothetical protein
MNTAVGVALLALAWLSHGCSVHAGLSNAPTLGATPMAPRRAHDVIANGNESCERLSSGSPLRGHAPPCEREAAPTSPVPAMAFVPLP